MGVASASRGADGWRGIWTDRRARLWLGAALFAAWVPVLGVPLRRWLDFSAFYTAGTLAFSPDVVRLEPIIQAQAAAGLPPAPYLYPPGFSILYAPLTWLAYDVAGALHLLLMLGALALAAALAARLYGIPRRIAMVGALAWGPAAASVLSGQNATLALLLIVISALAMVRAAKSGSRWAGMVAGVASAGLGYKPQFAAPIVAIAALRRRWIVLGVIGFGALLHYLVGVLAAGGNFGWPVDWLSTLSRYSSIDLETNGWQSVSLPSLLARVELSPLTDGAPPGVQGLSLIGYIVGAIVIAFCLRALTYWSLPRATALSCALTLLVLPHAWVYNATLLLPALAAFAAQAHRRRWPWQDRWVVAGAYAAGAIWPIGGLVGFTLLPLLVALAIPLLFGWHPFRGRASLQFE